MPQPQHELERLIREQYAEWLFWRAEGDVHQAEIVRTRLERLEKELEKLSDKYCFLIYPRTIRQIPRCRRSRKRFRRRFAP